MTQKLLTIFSVAGIGFLSNLIWENLQAPLYQSYASFTQHLPICAIATLGDVAIVLFLYLFMALLHRNLLWINRITKFDLDILVLSGTLVAIGIEKWALDTERWQYTSSMPVIPFIVSPVIALMVAE